MDQIGGAAHSGGSCQVAFSYDRGQTWIVVKSFVGNCPRVRVPGALSNNYDTNQDYTVTIPGDFPASDWVIFAWTWFNASGNREMYMSCSPVAIIGDTRTPPQGPPLFIANLQADAQLHPEEDTFWSECHVPHGISIIFPPEFILDTEVDKAPIALNPQHLPFNPQICSSANQEIREHLIHPGRKR